MKHTISLLESNRADEEILASICPQGMDSLRGTRVLVVDDDDFCLELARSVLEEIGVNVITVSSGFVALDVLKSVTFDCVFMDYEMPIMNGIETTLKIRADPRSSATCVIALTANSSLGDRERYLSSGMNDLVGKPYRGEQLIAALAKQMGAK